MPSPEEILSGLTRTSNEWVGVAVALHALLAALLYVLATRRSRLAARAVAALTVLPLFTVSLFAFLAGNPFNGVVFALAVAVLGALSRRVERGPLRPAPVALRAVGAAMVAFGWFYPHFLEARPFWFYAFAAPFGLVPCPTLSVVLGLSLSFGGFNSRAWSVVVGSLGLFYGVVGVARLGVWLDLPLAAAAAVSVASAFYRGRLLPDASGLDGANPAAVSD